MERFKNAMLGSTRPPASQEALAACGEELHLHVSLCRLLEYSDGAQLKTGAVLRVPDGSKTGAISILRADRLRTATQATVGLDAGLVAWANDGVGNYLMMDENGLVYFWDHDWDDLHPFHCDLDGLVDHFEFRIEGKKPLSAMFPTAAPLDELLRANGSPEQVQRLLDASLTDDTVEDYLLVAVNSERADVVEQILTSQTRIGAVLLNRPFAVACARGLAEIVDAFARAGVDVNARGRGGTPLMRAATSGQVDVVKRLIALGADPTVVSWRGFDVLRETRILANITRDGGYSDEENPYAQVVKYLESLPRGAPE